MERWVSYRVFDFGSCYHERGHPTDGVTSRAFARGEGEGSYGTCDSGEHED
jgi:hypothetical protein